MANRLVQKLGKEYVKSVYCHPAYLTYMQNTMQNAKLDELETGLYSQSYGFSNSHVQMWELDNKNGWAPKNWCLQTVVLKKTPESSLDSKEMKPVNLKGNQPWIFIGRTDADAEAEAPRL